MGAERKPPTTSIVFNISKNEEFSLQDNLKELHKYLRSNWKVLLQKDNLGPGTTGGHDRLIILPAPKDKFSEIEFNALRHHIEIGGKLLVLGKESMDVAMETNINFLLEEYGIMINQDCVIRVVPNGLLHPKESLILESHVPAVNEPTSKPIAFAANVKKKLKIAEYVMAPDVNRLAEEAKVVFSQSDPLPIDHVQLFDTKFFSLDTALLPEVLTTYEEIGVTHEMLKLIPPKFDIPLPPLQMALFPPHFMSCEPPPLELFDLEDAWRSDETKLLTSATKWLESRLESNIMQGSTAVGIEAETPKEALEKILQSILRHKCGEF